MVLFLVTLIEMLVVLAIISVLILLFVPNLMKEKKQVQKTGEAAVVKVVENQAEMYKLEHSENVSLSDLITSEMITKKQAESYEHYYAENKNETRSIPN